MDLELNAVLTRMIFSASGWRGIFAGNGDEESRSPIISREHRIIAAVGAKVFSDYLADKKGAVIVGRDSRPTGEAVADAVIRSLLSCGREVKYTGIVAAPEIMALARTIPSKEEKLNFIPAGFIYVTASHNPIGHNGIKFGLTDGGVLQGSEASMLLAAFNNFMAQDGLLEKAKALLEETAEKKISAVYSEQIKNKDTAMAAYREFTFKVISGYTDKPESKDFFALLKNQLKKRPLGIVADFNGSARTVSIDRDFFSSLGVKFCSVNDKPGEIAHRIVPEGESLNTCCAFLEKMHAKDSSFILGYMNDCDGDRGNLVIWDDQNRNARVLEAQEVLALACIAELSFLVWKSELKYTDEGKLSKKAAIAVNDPTSYRIDRIAEAFGVSVFRAEVGEANVVGLARELREKAYLVRVLGEGSAGGVIIHPSAVRDPIDTLGSILKLYAIRTGKNKDSDQGLFGIWHRLSKASCAFKQDFFLSDIISSLPAFASTGAYSEDAVLNVKTADHALLKNTYQKIFLREWEEKKTLLKEKYGISEWEAIAYNGTLERRGIASFGDAGRGGLKIEFFRGNKKNACIWMRGSGTESLFRVMADAEGRDRQLEQMLIKWQRQMVIEADTSIINNSGESF